MWHRWPTRIGITEEILILVKQNNKFLCLVLIAALICNLGQNKMEQLSPFPQSNGEGAKEQKRAILASLKWGGGVVQMFHLFCPRLWLCFLV